MFPWTPQDQITYSESEISDRIRMLQYAQKLCYENDLESRAASKRAFDVKKKFRQFKVNDKVLLYIPSPPKGNNSKFYTPWRGVYIITQKTSKLTYIVHKKGGRNRTAHINRLKFYDPKNSHKDPEVKISVEEDETIHDTLKDNTEQKEQENTRDKTNIIPINNDNIRITRSKTKALEKIDNAK